MRFMRLARALRGVRVMRLVRFIGALRSIVFAIMSHLDSCNKQEKNTSQNHDKHVRSCFLIRKGRPWNE